MITGVLKHKLFFVLTTFFLFLSFSFNMFGALTPDEFVHNYKDSEALVVNQIKCEGQLFANQLLEQKLVVAKEKGDCAEENFNAYSSQFGLQGKMYTAIYNPFAEVTQISAPVYAVSIQIITAFASALLLALFILWVRLRFGLTASIVTGVMIALSPMLVGFARNLYWSLPLLLAPIVYCLYFFKPGLRLKWMSLFYVGLCLLLYLRYLCGYEYITTITIMVVAVVGYELIMKGVKRMTFMKHAIAVGLVSFVAFAGALLTHISALNSFTGSFEKSAFIIEQRAQERTLNADKYTEYPYMNLKGLAPDHYKITDSFIHYDQRKEGGSKIWASFVAMSTYLLLPVVHLPILISPPLGQYIQSTAALGIVLVALYLTRRRWVAKRMSREVHALFGVVTIGFVGYLSWLVLAYSHSLVHAHINGILVYLPTALFGFIIFGLFVDSLIQRYKK